MTRILLTWAAQMVLHATLFSITRVVTLFAGGLDTMSKNNLREITLRMNVSDTLHGLLTFTSKHVLAFQTVVAFFASFALSACRVALT